MPTTMRNKVIFLTCLSVFFGIGLVAYIQWSDRKPFGVILFVADGLTPSNFAAARLFAGGSNFRFAMEEMPHLALASPRSRDYAVADAVAAATSISTGQEVNRGSLAISPEGQPLETILEAARNKGRATGLVSDTGLTCSTTAAFFARANDARDGSAIAVQLIGESMPDVILGGGEAQLLPREQGGARLDGRNLLLELRQRGYDIARTKSELDSTPGWRAPQTLGVFAEEDLAFLEDQVRYPTQPRLSELVRKAIELLQFNAKGYLLVVNAGLAGRAAQHSQAESLLRQIRELDDAVQVARRYAGEDSFIVVAGLGNTGGLCLKAFSFASDRGLAVLGADPSGAPAVVWAAQRATGETQGINGTSGLEAGAQAQPFADQVLVIWSGDHSEARSPVFIKLSDVNGMLKRQL